MIVHQHHEDREGESPPGRRNPLPMRPNIRALKDAVRIEDVARHYGAFKPSGAGRLLGRCVSPHHEDRTPSMTIYTSEGRFKCFGCGAHGDVIDLVVLAEGCELHEALVLLSQRHGIELPGRPDSWRRKQERQKGARDDLGRLPVEILCRRLYAIIEPMVLAVEDDKLRDEISRDVWGCLWRRAENMVHDRRKEGAA